MKIGIAGHISLSMLKNMFPQETDMPQTLDCPLISRIAQGLHDRGHEITIFALSSAVKETRYYPGAGAQVYISPSRRPRWQMADFFRAERNALTSAMLASGCDVIHAHWTYEFGAAAIKSKMPHVVTAHDTPLAVMRYASHPYSFEKALLAFPVIRRARNITTVSPYLTASLRGIRGNDDLDTIVNGVGPEVFALNSLRKRSSSRETVFAAVLNYWRGIKNAPRLLKAFADLRARLGSRVQLRLFGVDFTSEGPAATWVRAQGIDSGLHFCGPLPYQELLTTLARDTDVLVHPSLEESFCMAAVEAMAIGLPVIAGQKSGAIPWVLAHGKAGLLVDVESPAAISAGMLKMAENENLRADLAAEGRTLAFRDYRIEPVVDKYLSCLTVAAKEG